MTNFNYVGKDVFHSTDLTKYNEKYSLYFLLSKYLDVVGGKDVGYTEETLMLKIQMGVSSSYKDKMQLLLNHFYNTYTDEDIKSLLLIQMSVVSAGGSADLAELFNSLSFKGFTTDQIDILIKEDLSNDGTSYFDQKEFKSLPTGGDNGDIITISNSILLLTNNPTIKSINLGATVMEYTKLAMSELSKLLLSMQSGNNWSLDYILSLLRDTSRSVNTNMSIANKAYIEDVEYQNSLRENASNSSNILTSVTASNYILSIGSNPKSNNLSQSEYYFLLGDLQSMAYDTFVKVYESPSIQDKNLQMEMAADYADIVQQVNTAIFVSNLDKGLNNVLASQNHLNIVGNSQNTVSSVMNADAPSSVDLLLIENSLESMKINKLQTVSTTTGQGLSTINKISNKVPFDPFSIAGLSALLMSAKNVISNFLKQLHDLFFGSSGAGGLDSFFNDLLGKLNEWLKNAIGPLAVIIAGLILAVTAVIVAINAVLCIIKGLLCLIGSIINALSSAYDMAMAIADKIGSAISAGLSALGSIGDLSSLFSVDIMGAINDAIAEGITALENEIAGLLASAGVPLDKIKEAWDSLMSGDMMPSCDQGDLMDTLKDHASELMTEAYDAVANFIEEGLACKLDIPIPDVSLPSLSLPSISLPSLSLPSIGC